MKNLRDKALQGNEQDADEELLDADDSKTRQYKAPMDGDLNEYTHFQDALEGFDLHD